MLDKELLTAFQDESTGLLNELSAITEKLEDSAKTGDFPTELLKEFSQKIDRIMGAAKTMGTADPGNLGLERISRLAELLKFIGYKAADQKNIKLLPIFAAFWNDAVSTCQELVSSLEDEAKTRKIAKEFLPILQKRLEWLKTKVAPSGESTSLNQIDVDSVLKSFEK
jgi:hypothetical protein